MRRYFTILDAILPSNHGITRNDFQIDNVSKICVLRFRSNLHDSKFVATAACSANLIFHLYTLCRQKMYTKACFAHKENKFQDGNTHK